jgi:hypothetical protein
MAHPFERLTVAIAAWPARWELLKTQEQDNRNGEGKKRTRFT